MEDQNLSLNENFSGKELKTAGYILYKPEDTTGAIFKIEEHELDAEDPKILRIHKTSLSLGTTGDKPHIKLAEK